MAGMSDYLENKILDLTLRGVAFTAPTSVYVALFTNDPTDAGTGTEVSGGAYARQVMTFNAASNGSIANSSDVLFPVATASWGTVTHFAIYDAATAGNMLYSGALLVSKAVASGDQIKIAAGDITVSLD